MSLPKPEPLCRYHYDPLNRLAGCSSAEQASTHCFYRLNRLATEIQGHIQTSCLRIEDQHLALWQQDADTSRGVLIAADAQGSVVHAVSAVKQQAFTYMPYGVRDPHHAPLHWPGFNGERLDPVTGHYLLGNGYRAFNPVLMRFNSPDSVSPFGSGGLNAYAYCLGNPVNRVDPSGHFFKPLFRWFFGKRKLIYGKGEPITELVPSVYIFGNNMDGKNTVFIHAHSWGDYPTKGYHPLASENFTISPERIAPVLKKRQDIALADVINVVGCYSGSGSDPFARQLSRLLNKPVVGYEGVVIATSIERSLFRTKTGMAMTTRPIKIHTHLSLKERLAGHKSKAVTFTDYAPPSLSKSATNIRNPRMS